MGIEALVTSRKRTMSFKELQRKEKSAERRAVRAAHGRWNYFETVKTLAITASVRGSTILVFGRAAGDGKRTHWGYDGLLAMSLRGATDEVLTGAIVSYYLRPGQTHSDFFANTNFMLPEGSTKGNDLARYYNFMPIALIGNQESTRGALVIPWKDLLPKDMVLKPDTTFNVAVSFWGTDAAGILINTGGRFRYIDGTT